MQHKTLALLKSQAYIDGRWVSGDMPGFPVLDKTTGAILADVTDLDVAEARAAIEAAHRAFGSWSRRLAKERAILLRTWYDLIVRHADDLAYILTLEQGKPFAEAKAEVLYGAAFVEFFAEEAKRVRGEIIPAHKADARTVVLQQPIGVVAAITPWNFPNAMIARKVSPALAAGCTVVVKPAEETPLSALALAALAHEAGLPPGVLNIVTCRDPVAVGYELSTNPSVKAVTFTGSTEVGKILMRQAAGTVKRVCLELGGNAPFIVFDDADLDRAVAAALAGKFRNAGQACVSPNRFLVQSGVFDALAAKLTTAVATIQVGGPVDEAREATTQGSIAIGPLINAAALEKVSAHVADAVAKGATVLTGGKPHARGGTFFEPTVLTGVRPDMRVFQEETFGPVAPLLRFTTDDEAIALANATPFGLAAYFHTRDLSRAWRVAEALDFGIVGINEGLVSSELVPFGGVKESGLGREGSHHGIAEFLETKYMLMGGI